jgi:GntR family transcriptional repressor for pyruvate dehydrogenase complex
VVASQLAQLVVDKKLALGDHLASENELSRHYEVSRPNIRQALHRLAAAGLVETRHGVGTFISHRRKWNLFDPLLLNAFMRSGNLSDIAQELIELRRMVEVECAGLAAERMSTAEIKQLEKDLRRMDLAQGDVGLVTEADLAFHEVIILASNNRFLQGIMAFLHEPLSRARRLTWQTGDDQSRMKAQQGHRAIYDAIAGRDAQSARSAMLAHMRQLEEDMEAALLAI